MSDRSVGDYINEDSLNTFVHFSINRFLFTEQWSLCAHTARYITHAFASFFDFTPVFENTVSTVFNEIIENAVKFSATDENKIIVVVSSHDGEGVCTIANTMRECDRDSFFEYSLDFIAKRDFGERYIRALENESAGKKGGVGLLLVANLLGPPAFNFTSDGKVEVQVRFKI